MAIERISRPGEVWKPVLGYEESYEVSNLGRVWSIPIGKGEHGTGRILAAHPDKKGYPRCSLKGKTFKVHHLVLNAFVGVRPPGYEGCHLDGNPSNPALTNLMWGTVYENRRHMKIHGTQRMGFDCHLTVLTPEKVRERQLYT